MALNTEDKPRDFPFKEMCKAAEERIREGHTVYQKFTCA